MLKIFKILSKLLFFKLLRGFVMSASETVEKIVRIKHFSSWKNNKLSTSLFIIQIKFLKSTVLNRALPSFKWC